LLISAATIAGAVLIRHYGGHPALVLKLFDCDLEYTEFGVRQLERLMVEVGRERRLYRRYLGEARAQRKKALKAWCAFNRAENLNSRNELKLQSKREIA